MSESHLSPDLPLVQTKLFIPTPRPNIVKRPRLLKLLSQDFFSENTFLRNLTLIAAPAGYGKTTLIAEWLHTLDLPVAWLSLDSEDNDPGRIVAYIIAAVQAVSPELGDALQEMRKIPQQPTVEELLGKLINEISTRSTPLILSLDDYHVIHLPQIHQALNFLADHLPPHLHLIILSREDPPFPIMRLQARGELLVLRQKDLKFSEGEALEFFKQLGGILLSKGDVQALMRRTEGWATGLQLAALSLRGTEDPAEFVRSFTGSNRYILDYLIEEVFERQSPETREFLLKTSILERMSAPLCDMVAERGSSQKTLEELEQSNLFVVPLDQSRTWYRYHRLFSELLRNRLRSAGQYDEASLHKLARKWFAAEGLISEAINHALAAEDWPQAVVLVNQAADALLKRGELLTLINWCQKIPQSLIRKHPNYGLSYAWALLLIGRFDDAEELLTHFEDLASSIPDLQGEVATAQAFAARARGDNRKVIEKSELALTLLPDNEFTSRSTLAMNLGLVYWHVGRLREAVPILNEAQEMAERAGNHYAGLTAQIFLARTRASQGALKQAKELLIKTIQIGGEIPILVLSHYDLCCIYYEWNELGKAWEHLDQGLEMCMSSGNLEFQNGGHMLKAYLLMAQGNMLGALSEVETSHALSQEFGPATQARSMACHAEIALTMGDLDTAKRWVEQMPEEVDAHSLYRFIGLTYARMLLAQNEKAAAQDLLSNLIVRATEAGWGYATVPIRALQVIATEAEQEAIDLLSEAMKISRPEGFIRSYVEVGRPLIPLLKEVARRGTMPEYAGQILNAYGDKIKKSTLPLVEPLSERELEVMRLVAAGLSNREIADKLVISIGTAKSHVHNICGKLGVRNRTEAAMRAKELNIV
jgi:LuxR family maltose regulon positive regulatory protein